MKMIDLGATGRRTTVLGYGCAGLMRPTSGKERIALLQAAFDAGIRHFDIARYYGHGGSEAILGQFISDSRLRDQVTITTKFGIQPTPLGGSSLGKRLMNAARRFASIHPSIRKVLSRAAGGTTRTNCFNPEAARLSLETSLRELRTDYVDLFLLHEATWEDTQTPGLLEFLEQAKRSGKILAFGCASQPLPTLQIAEQAPAFASVVQMANAPGAWNREKLPPDPQRFVLTHGALKKLPELETAFSQSKGDGPFKSARGTELAGLLLGLALHKNPAGITLFSSTYPKRIGENVAQTIRTSLFAAATWAAFETAASQASTKN